MCYSAQVKADYRSYVHRYGAIVDLPTFFLIFWDSSNRAKRLRGLDMAFQDDATPEHERIRFFLANLQAEERIRLTEQLAQQHRRLLEAERSLVTKPTKKAAESARVAANKLHRYQTKLDDLSRRDPNAQDGRLFPGVHAPVMCLDENGRRVVRAMRYGCRPSGKPAYYDERYPGTYNARRDNLQGFWKGQFGTTHGVVIVSSFYEYVQRDGESVVLEFRPRDGQDMLIACLWSHWQGAGEPDLYSFAAITDAPPPEVAATGHDRCIVPIKAAHLDAWLNPDPRNLAASYAVLDDRDQISFEWRVADS